jgi:hypothetical protein
MKYWLITCSSGDEDGCSCDMCYSVEGAIFFDEDTAKNIAAIANATIECEADIYTEYFGYLDDDGINGLEERIHVLYGDMFHAYEQNRPDTILGCYV